MTKWQEDHTAMIEDCEKRESRLSSWEVDFMASISSQLSNGKSLSPRQTDRLNEIWERVTANG